MAEIAVNFVLDKLGSLLVEEMQLEESTRKKVLGIKSELESIKAFLKDAEGRAAAEDEKGEGEEVIKTWIKQVREETYRIEDVIDEFSFKRALAQLPHGRGLVGNLHKFGLIMKELKLNREICNEIKDIKSSLEDIHRRGKIYRFRYIDEGSISGTRNLHDSQIASFFIDDDEVLGIEYTRDQLIKLLVNGGLQRSVIVVLGEGGSGKTTLSGKIQNNEAVKKHFDCQAWITTGKEYTKEDLLRRIILELFRRKEEIDPRQIDKMEEKELITKLREYLKDKSYMVVFDDVWKIDFWNDVEHALLDNNKSSRVMITTRHKAVADFVPGPIRHVHLLDPLPPDEAWLLFCRKAFGSDSCPQELEEVSEKIVEKCGGLPLAIVALGGLMSTKRRHVSEWKNSLHALGSKLGSDPHLKSCNRVLSEGYYNLPHHLKPCLLYFGLFPEGYSINCARLIRLWIAEGFVPYNKYPSPELLAREYLNELNDRSLVQVLERDIYGRARICRVHGLMHEIILRMTRELGFCGILKAEELDHCSKARRISIQRSGTHNVPECMRSSQVRSVFLFKVRELPDSFISTCVANFKLMKVLDFQDAPIKRLPEEVGYLLHLHYLSVRNAEVKILPKSIGMLSNLETLDLKHSLVTELPVEIKNLKKLRHLLVYRLVETDYSFARGAKIPEGFGSLKDMQKLRFVLADSKVLQELSQLRQLRNLGIVLINGNGRDLSTCIENLNNLESLSVESPCKEDILDIESIASPPQCLQSLHIRGNMKKLPAWITKLKNLTVLDLDLFGLTEDPMTVIQALPNLLKLHLNEKYHDELILKEGCFPKLQELTLRDLSRVKSMKLLKGAMPNLRVLTIGPCPQLKEIPTGIDHLRNLKILEFRDALKETYCMIRKENWVPVTKHIPEILVSYQRAGKYFCQPIKYISSMSPEDMEKLF